MTFAMSSGTNKEIAAHKLAMHSHLSETLGPPPSSNFFSEGGTSMVKGDQLSVLFTPIPMQEGRFGSTAEGYVEVLGS